MGAGLNFYVRSLHVLPDGDVLAGGESGAAGAGELARWDGTSWTALGSGWNGPLRAMIARPDGDVVIGGDFTVAAGNVSARIARLTTTCPASAIAFGSGCSSSVGPMVLAANTLPWVGSTFRSTCTAFAPNALGVVLFGFTSPGTPLAALHPAGGLGCTLLASLDAIQMLPNTGSIVNQLSIPNDPVFAGVVMNHQVLQLEIGVASSITRIASSNGLTVTIGVF